MKKNALLVALLTLALALGLSGIARADYAWYSYEGHEYALTQKSGPWTDNEEEAVSTGGHLVTINSGEEETWLRGKFGTGTLWIGLTQIPGSTEPAGGWVWINGDDVTYNHWAPGEPNNIPWGIPGLGDENKGVMNWAADGGWNDLLYDTSEFNGFGIIERNSAVPLPSAVLLLGTGLMGLGAVGWRRRQV